MRSLEIVEVIADDAREGRKIIRKYALDREIAVDRLADVLYPAEDRYEVAEELFDALVEGGRP